MSAMFDHSLITHPIFTHPGVWIHPGTLKGTEIVQPWLDTIERLNSSHAIFHPYLGEYGQQHPDRFSPLSSSYDHGYQHHTGQGSHCSRTPRVYDNRNQINPSPRPSRKPSFRLNPLAPVFRPRPFRSLLDPEADEFRPRPPAIVNGTTPIVPNRERYLGQPSNWREQRYIPREHTQRAPPRATNTYIPYGHTHPRTQRKNHHHNRSRNHNQNHNYQPTPLRHVQTPTTQTPQPTNYNTNTTTSNDSFPDARACIVLHTSHNAFPYTIPQLRALVDRHTTRPLTNGQPAGSSIVGG